MEIKDKINNIYTKMKNNKLLKTVAVASVMAGLPLTAGAQENSNEQRDIPGQNNITKVVNDDGTTVSRMVRRDGSIMTLSKVQVTKSAAASVREIKNKDGSSHYAVSLGGANGNVYEFNKKGNQITDGKVMNGGELASEFRGSLDDGQSLIFSNVNDAGSHFAAFGPMVVKASVEGHEKNVKIAGLDSNTVNLVSVNAQNSIHTGAFGGGR